MKYLLFKIPLIIGVSLSSSTISNFAIASTNTFSCERIDGVYSIFRKVERGKINYIKVTRDLSNGYSIEKRCNIIAERFQKSYESGILKIAKPDILNNSPVICSVVQENVPCNSENILVTLPPKTHPIQAARTLMDISGLYVGNEIEVCGTKCNVENTTDDGITYYNLEALETLIMNQKDSPRFIPE